MRGIYENGFYLDMHPSWHREDSAWKAQQIARILGRNSLSPSTICEVGCGAGEVLNQLAENFPDIQYYGYEISPQAFALCEAITKKNLHFFLEDLLEDREKSFDVVMAIDVFEHVEDYIGFLKKLRRKGKYAIFHIPLDLSVQTILRVSPILNYREGVGHLHYFTKETALATLTYAGYELLDYFYTCGSLELPGRGWKANLLRLPRKLWFRFNKDLAVRVLGGFSLLVLAQRTPD